jgi:hypothetical protein
MRTLWLFVAGGCLGIAACGANTTAQTTTTSVTTAQQAALRAATPPPAISTPVPIVRARPLPGQGRPDPFIALYGPPTGGPNVAASPGAAKTVAVSTFPNIPTLPGFETVPNAPGGINPGRPIMHSIWDGVRVSGIVHSIGYTAIVEAAGKSFIVRPGDLVASTFRVVAIGPDSVTLATDKEERHLTLGG